MTFFSQECQTEMLAHQASLDYVNQPLQTCSTDEGHRGRYEHKQFAEEQGRLNHQWLSLQETLNSQVRRQTVTKQLQIKVYVNLFLYPPEEICCRCCCLRCSDPGGGAGAEEQNGAGGPTAADQQLDHRSEPLDRLSSDTQQPDGTAKEHQHLPGQRSHV